MLSTRTRNGPPRRTAILAASLSLVGPATALAQVHWVNSAGGPFAQASNWDAGHIPGGNDTAAFSLASTYTVSLAAPTTIGSLAVDQGSPTLDLGGSQLGVDALGGHVTIGTMPGSAATLRLINGTFSVGNLTALGGVAGSSGTLTVEADAMVNVGNGTFNIGGAGAGYLLVRGTVTDSGADKEKYLYAGSTIHVDPSGHLNLRYLNNMGGRLEVAGGLVNAQALNAPGLGEIVASSAAIISASDMLTAAGPVTLTGGSRINAPATAFSGDVLLDGTNTRITGDFSGSPTSVTLRNGGALRPNSMDISGNPFIWVGSGCTISVALDFYFRGGTLHAEPGATLMLNHLVMSNSPVIELVIDGAALPSTPIITTAAAPQLPIITGTFRPKLIHPNNLHVGNQVELLRVTPGILNTTFSALDAQPLGGGRQLQLTYTTTSVFLTVVAGGPACWGNDFNGDGAVATDADIEAFFACIAGSCCPTCAPADFNGDGTPGTDADIDAFFRVLAGEAC
jgi:hypothetical protein